MIVRLAVSLLSNAEVAVTVDVVGAATSIAWCFTAPATAGATNVTEVVVELVKVPVPLALQETPLLSLSFISVAVMFSDWPASMDWAAEGVRVTTTGLRESLHPATKISVVHTNT